MALHTPTARTVHERRAAGTAVLCALASTSAITATWWPEAALPTLQWLVGLSIHWQWLYAPVGGVALLAWLVLGRARFRRILLPAGVCAAVLALAWASHSAAAPEAPPAAPVFRVASANLQIGNPHLPRLQAWLTTPESPDVVMLQEFGPDAARLVAQGPVRTRYPHQLLLPSDDPFGIALLSRHPFSHTEVVHRPATRHTPRLRARVTWAGREVALSAVHPMPPLDRGWAVARDQALREEAAWLAAAAPLGVLAGDLNDSPWSTGIRGVAPVLRRATSLVPTWPSLGGWFSLLPLDHVLVTEGWTRVAAARGPDLGSDHRPVTADLAPK